MMVHGLSGASSETAELAQSFRIERLLLLIEEVWDLPHGTLAPGNTLVTILDAAEKPLQAAALEAAIEQEFDVIVNLPGRTTVGELVAAVCRVEAS